MKVKGAVPEIFYPYIANQSKCGPNSVIVTFPLIKDTFEYRINSNEKIMKNLVAKEGKFDYITQ